ncbi:hypothetical protein VTL71DRAFT_3043 [Oculimacula yallundae]|uniref:Uncharacterized protein n=1 Tax=Oculimacula yallundae TaxID=86028 RepID=A0ABR4C604_9HELO
MMRRSSLLQRLNDIHTRVPGNVEEEGRVNYSGSNPPKEVTPHGNRRHRSTWSSDRYHIWRDRQAIMSFCFSRHEPLRLLDLMDLIFKITFND